MCWDLVINYKKRNERVERQSRMALVLSPGKRFMRNQIPIDLTQNIDLKHFIFKFNFTSSGSSKVLF